jgi:leucyl/phenylalanyl-tRNA---protein transferase
MIPWIAPGAGFPPVGSALSEPNGLLAASSPSELSSDQLVAAYSLGVFPWYCEGQPALWWSPDPRMVLFVDELHVSRSLGKQLRATAECDDLELRLDAAFESVMHACAQPREGHDGTWITEDIVRAYGGLAGRDLAHSIELWRAGRLVGGLYGVSLGRMFYGESMFSREPGASKIALAALVQILRREGVAMIDCQQHTAHLASLGAREIARERFAAAVADAVGQAPIDWSQYRGRRLNSLLSLAPDR